MNESEKLCRRDFLGKSLGIFSILETSLAAYRAGCSSQETLKIDYCDPQIETFPLSGLIPRPKYSLYAPVKGSISFDDDGCDVFHHQGVILGFWWQPEAWCIPVGWVYQVYLINSQDSQDRVSMVEELPENELIKENLIN